jgi:hypothetical protein
MCTKKITHITFTGNNKKQTTVNLAEKEQEALMRLANCLVNEAKALVK